MGLYLDFVLVSFLTFIIGYDFIPNKHHSNTKFCISNFFFWFTEEPQIACASNLTILPLALAIAFPTIGTGETTSADSVPHEMFYNCIWFQKSHFWNTSGILMMLVINEWKCPILFPVSTTTYFSKNVSHNDDYLFSSFSPQEVFILVYFLHP